MSIPPYIAGAICSAGQEILRIDGVVLNYPGRRWLDFLAPHIDWSSVRQVITSDVRGLLKMLKRPMFRALRASGLPFVFRELVQRNRVTVLTYHDLGPKWADEHLSVLKKKYNIIPLNAYLDARKNGTVNKLPRKSLVITLDDGWKKSVDLVPVMRKHGVVPTIFIVSDFPRREEHLAEHQRRFLRREEILAMSPYVDFQAHTIGHIRLPYVSAEESWEQVLKSKQHLESDLGLRIRSLAFPNGDYSERDMALIEAAGYECALTGDNGYNSGTSNLYGMKRICIGDDDDLDAVLVRACGLWGFIRRIFVKPSFGRVELDESRESVLTGLFRKAVA